MMRINRIEEISQVINEKDVVLYGAGKYGVFACENIKNYYPRSRVRYFIDDNRLRNPDPVMGIEIVSLEEAMHLLDEFIIVIANFYVDQVMAKIEKAGFPLEKVFFWNALLIEDVSENVIKRHAEDFRHVYGMLEDYKSKQIYRTMIRCHDTKQFDILSRTCDAIQYFPRDIFRVDENEVFVDGGGYNGDTIEQFSEFVGNKYKRIYTFEPDEINHKCLKQNIIDERVDIYNGGLYSFTGQLNFSGSKGGSSKVDAEGENAIKVYSLDDMDLCDKQITFVKMDIEGSELEALKGMRKIIKNNKPKLAICIYHKFSDLWEIPLYIKELVPEYRLYIRNYTTYLDEVVMYATT